MPGRKKNCRRRPHSVRRGNTGLLHSDKSVRHGEHLLQPPRRGGPGPQPSLFSFKDSGFKPSVSLIKGRKPPLCGSAGSRALFLLSPLCKCEQDVGTARLCTESRAGFTWGVRQI